MLIQFLSKKTYIINYVAQEFLKKEYICSNTVYCCTHHSKYLNRYLKVLDKIF